jgi:hypothetical protein
MLFRLFRTSLVSLARPSEGTDGFLRSIAMSRLPLDGAPQTDITSGARFRQACAPAAGSLNYELCGKPLEPQSFKSLRRGYRTGTKERKCHGFDEEVSLPTFLCKNRKVTPFAQPEGRQFEFSRNHFQFVFYLRTSWTKLSAASSRPSEFNSELP